MKLLSLLCRTQRLVACLLASLALLLAMGSAHAVVVSVSTVLTFPNNCSGTACSVTFDLGAGTLESLTFINNTNKLTDGGLSPSVQPTLSVAFVGFSLTPRAALFSHQTVIDYALDGVPGMPNAIGWNTSGTSAVNYGYVVGHDNAAFLEGTLTASGAAVPNIVGTFNLGFGQSVADGATLMVAFTANVNRNYIAPVPEPTSAALLVAGGLALLLIRSRRTEATA